MSSSSSVLAGSASASVPAFHSLPGGTRMPDTHIRTRINTLYSRVLMFDMSTYPLNQNNICLHHGCKHGRPPPRQRPHPNSPIASILLIFECQDHGVPG